MNDRRQPHRRAPGATVSPRRRLLRAERMRMAYWRRQMRAPHGSSQREALMRLEREWGRAAANARRQLSMTHQEAR